MTESSTPDAGKTVRPAVGDPLLEAMRDAADELDAIVAGSMSNREHQLWRLCHSE